MKTPTLMIALGLLAGCTAPTDDQSAAMPAAADSQTPAATAETPAATAAASATTASATGVVESVDPAARTVTIAHDPVATLQWPAMTMTFQAPDVDLGAIEQGDRVAFEFTSSGMDGTITSIRQQ